MRVLALGPSPSPHTIRSLGLFAEQGVDVHLFSPIPAWIFPEPASITVHAERDIDLGNPDPSVRIEPLEPQMVGGLQQHERPAALAGLIRKLEPDLVLAQVHQISGYLVLAARELLGPEGFPPVVAHDWGLDVSLFHTISRERRMLGKLFSVLDGLYAETVRDIALSQGLGFRGEVGPTVPVTGGYDLAMLREQRQPGAASARKAISVKGMTTGRYQGHPVLDGLERVGERLSGYELQVYTAEPDFAERAEVLCERTGMELRSIPYGSPVPHEELMALHGRSRISIAAAHGDGLCTSSIDAFAMGSYPIQSDGAASQEWGVDGRDLSLFSLERPDELTAALERALDDDELVDAASARNIAEADLRLDRDEIAATMTDFVRGIAERPGNARPAARGEALSRAAAGRESERALTRRRRELLEVACIGGDGGGEQLEADRLMAGVESDREWELLLDDLLWAVGRQIDAHAAISAIEHPPKPTVYAGTHERDSTWVEDGSRVRSLIQGTMSELIEANAQHRATLAEWEAASDRAAELRGATVAPGRGRTLASRALGLARRARGRLG